jgi:hypothetical protein
MTYSNGTRWEQDVDRGLSVDPALRPVSVADDLIRLDDESPDRTS